MKYFVFLLIIIVTSKANSQELPPIIKFSPEDYNADNQNWMISQDDDNNYIYVANNKGLLEYNGSEWNVYPTPNKTIIRSVKVVANKIYTGCYADFGYWEKNNLGVLEYNSLKSKLEGRKLEDEEIWNIISYNEWVIFQSNRSIYLYDSENQKFRIIDATNIVFKIFKVGDKIYYHVAKTLNAWTVNSINDMDWLLLNQFNYITTDEPELLLERIEKFHLQNTLK